MTTQTGPQTQAMTAADHFLTAEALLAKSKQHTIGDVRVPSDQQSQAYAARAAAHLKAAKLLLRAEELRGGHPDALRRTGMDTIVRTRATAL